ncbi:hypothetical protein DCD76_18485, partial [Acinetobacter baumannii]
MVVSGVFIHLSCDHALVVLRVAPTVADGRHVVTIVIVGVEGGAVVLAFGSFFLRDELSADTTEGVFLQQEAFVVDSLAGKHVTTEGAV